MTFNPTTRPDSLDRLIARLLRRGWTDESIRELLIPTVPGHAIAARIAASESGYRNSTVD